MPNIKFSYLYRDGGNYKNYSFLIFENPENVSLAEFETLIRSKLIDGIWFYVNDWKLLDLSNNNYSLELDPTWHEFDGVEYTDEPANTPIKLLDLIAVIRQMKCRNLSATHYAPKVNGAKNKTELLFEKAADLAEDLTNYNIIEKGLTATAQIEKERVENHGMLQNALLQRGVNLKRRKK